MRSSAEQIKKLRAATGAGILDCRNALEASDGDLQKATELLRERGLARAEKKADRETSAGVLDLYSHGEGRVGVMVEVNCETDFVARTDEFRDFAHEIALQIAAASPIWVSEEDVPLEILEAERKIARANAGSEGKPDHVIDSIVDGRLAKFLEENCLLRQEYIREGDKTVNELLLETVATVGENIKIRRFERWSVGEPLE